MVQVSFHVDQERRDAETLLREWPTLTGVALGVARAGVDVTIVQGASRREKVDREGVVFHFVDRDLIGTVESMKPDVVHVHGFIRPFRIRELTKTLRGVPIMVQDHATRPPTGWRRVLLRNACRRLSGVAFTARAQADPFFRLGVFRPDLPVFEVIEGSTSFTPGDRDNARNRSGITGDPCFLWTGHLDQNKDPLTTLAAFELAVPSLPDARLWCCFGKAPLLKEVQERIARSPVLSSRVSLLGAQPHHAMESFFRAADFFVQSSHFEGSSYSAIEALACGTPPLVTDIPSMRRITNGQVGSLTPVGDATVLAGAMIDWARRNRNADRRAAREWFERELSFDAIGRQLRNAYETLASGSRPTS